jgi:mediator of RNA polymerase II transcription subunit 25
MVINETPVADVVLLIEATANLSPYVESLKTNYIIPTLEYFSGGPPDERDYGFDNNFNCSLYALVAFMTVDCAPEPASICFAPTTSSHKLLQWLDKIQFIGGAGESCSHITEGFSTALQVFDDFASLRETTASNIMAKTTKHCILICNSPPYSVQTVESQTYFGLMIDQLAGLMAEKQINFSIFSPRKMSFLYKLFEDAGGDLSQALNKNYAKDKRHLVLLRGFQLQERPMSPQTGSQSTVAEQKSQQQQQNSPLPISQMGIKRPLSPGIQSVAIASSASNVTSTSNSVVSQMHPIVRGTNIANTDIGSPFPQPSKTPTPDTLVKQPRGASPVPISQWSSGPTVTSVAVSSSSSPTPTPLLKGQLNMRPRSGVPAIPTPNLQHQTGIQQTTPTLLGLVSQPPQPIKQQNAANPQVRPGLGTPQMRTQQPVPSPFSAPQAPSPSQPQPSPLSIQRAVSSPLMQQSVASPTTTTTTAATTATTTATTATTTAAAATTTTTAPTTCQYH